MVAELLFIGQNGWHSNSCGGTLSFLEDNLVLCTRLYQITRPYTFETSVSRLMVKKYQQLQL
jgi:hypothetical protein